jgi:tryptophan 2,3-dioxygenase
MNHPPRPLLYSTYINDRAIVESLTMADLPLGVPPERWPVPPAGWKPGDRWPTAAEAPNWVHDEPLFIRTHQAFEVWFALILHELDSLLLEAGSLWSASSSIPRVTLPHPHEGSESDRYSARDWPKLDATLQSAQRADPGFEGLAESVGNPLRYTFASGLAAPTSPAEARHLSESLVRWAARLERARQALLCTIPFFDVLSTLTPAQFLTFRDRLQPASGFGSVQFREIELTLGLRELHHRKLRPTEGTADPEPGEPPLPPGLLRPTANTPGPERTTCFYAALTPWGRQRVATRHAGPSLRDVVYGLLAAAFDWANPSHPAPTQHAPLEGLPDLSHARVDAFAARALEATIDDQYRGLPTRALDGLAAARMRDGLVTIDAALANRETVVAALFEMNPHVAPLTAFLQTALRFDAALLQWRDRHIRFVEGQIGMRRGTGGGGIQYLRMTTAPKLDPHLTHGLPCLWQARSLVQRET